MARLVRLVAPWSWVPRLANAAMAQLWCSTAIIVTELTLSHTRRWKVVGVGGRAPRSSAGEVAAAASALAQRALQEAVTTQFGTMLNDAALLELLTVGMVSVPAFVPSCGPWFPISPGSIVHVPAVIAIRPTSATTASCLREAASSPVP